MSAVSQLRSELWLLAMQIFTSSPCVCVGFLQVIQLPPIAQ